MELAANDVVRRRILDVTADVPQAEIARKTNTSRSNVHRYLKGGMIPVEFCCSVVEAFDVNPVWLLTGEGTPQQSDVTTTTLTTASDVTELINAMSAVMKLRLGSLVGKEHKKVLRELNEAVERHDAIQTRLHAYFEPFYKDWLDAFDNALAERNLKGAVGLQQALRKVSRLCNQPELETRRHMLEGLLARYQGRHDEALSLQRRSFWGRLTLDSATTKERVHAAIAFAVALASSGRCKEALGVMQAVMGEAGSDKDCVDDYWFLRFVHASIQASMGDLRSTLTDLITAYQRLDKRHIAHNRHVFEKHMLMAGAATLREQIDASRKIKHPDPFLALNTARELIEAACFTENGTLIAAARKHFVNFLEDSSSDTPDVIDVWSRMLLATLNAAEALKPQDVKREQAIQELLHAEEPNDRLIAHALVAQIARHSKDFRTARTHVRHTAECLAQIPEELSFNLLPIALHHKNVLLLGQAGKLCDDELLHEACDFFVRHFDRGWGFFRREAEIANVLLPDLGPSGFQRT